MIFKENVGGTETVSQAVVTNIVNTSSVYGTVTLLAAPTFPSGGYNKLPQFLNGNANGLILLTPLPPSETRPPVSPLGSQMVARVQIYGSMISRQLDRISQILVLETVPWPALPKNLSNIG